MLAVEVNDENGDCLGKVKVGDTKLQALQRLSRAGGLFDKDDVGLLDSDSITAEGGPYVFKKIVPEVQPQQQQYGELSCCSRTASNTVLP